MRMPTSILGIDFSGLQKACGMIGVLNTPHINTKIPTKGHF
jgi:hypothetical protein